MRTVFNLMAIAVLIVLLASCNSNHSDTAQSAQGNQEESIISKLEKAKTSDEVKQIINGTTWHCTENLSNSEIGCWIKVEFMGDNFTTYYAMPSDGKWTQSGSGQYQINEGRYTNTGEKYISVDWVGKLKIDGIIEIPCELKLTTEDLTLHVGSSFIESLRRIEDMWSTQKPTILTCKMEYGDYAWD